MFDLKELQTFVWVAEHRNFTIVAKRQNTVQSAISAQVQKLEQVLGQRLVSRGRGISMSLTAEGEAFLVYARRILSLSEEAIETVQTADTRQILRLGTTVTLAMSIVCEVLGRFARERTDVQIQIQCDRSDQLLRRLEDGDVDVAFMMDQGRHKSRKFVHSMDLNWVCSSDFHLDRGGPIPLAFQTDGKDLRSYAFKALDMAGLEGRVTHLSPHPIGVRSLVQAGLAMTVMPSRTIVVPLVTAPEHWNLPRLVPIALSAYLGAGGDQQAQATLIDHLANACQPSSPQPVQE